MRMKVDSMLYYLDGKNPVKTTDLHEWSEHFTFDNKVVAFDEINGVQISTIFLGVDLGHGTSGPLLFETLIDDTQIIIYRYSTWEQAKAGHLKAVDMVTESQYANEK